MGIRPMGAPWPTAQLQNHLGLPDLLASEGSSGGGTPETHG